MQLTAVDWAVVVLYFVLNVAIGFYYKARAGKSVNEFFLSGRNVPWWLAGTSMVATTFAADTPLAVTGLVARGGGQPARAAVLRAGGLARHARPGPRPEQEGGGAGSGQKGAGRDE